MSRSARQRTTRRYSRRNAGRFPRELDELTRGLGRAWWCYSIEFSPGFVTGGQYPPEFPIVSRIVLRRRRVEDMSCLDIGMHYSGNGFGGFGIGHGVPAAY